MLLTYSLGYRYSTIRIEKMQEGEDFCYFFTEYCEGIMRVYVKYKRVLCVLFIRKVFCQDRFSLRGVGPIETKTCFAEGEWRDNVIRDVLTNRFFGMSLLPSRNAKRRKWDWDGPPFSLEEGLCDEIYVVKYVYCTTRKILFKKAYMTSRKTVIIFWVTTTILFLFEGVLPALTSHTEMAKEGMRHLGYPAYFGVTLTVFKILGAVALILPVVPKRIKEWAYAGFAFDFIFATVSLLMVDGLSLMSVFPLFFLGILTASYVSFHYMTLEKV